MIIIRVSIKSSSKVGTLCRIKEQKKVISSIVDRNINVVNILVISSIIGIVRNEDIHRRSSESSQVKRLFRERAVISTKSCGTLSEREANSSVEFRRGRKSNVKWSRSRNVAGQRVTIISTSVSGSRIVIAVTRAISIR